MIVGIRAIVEYALYARYGIADGFSFILCARGAIALFGGFSIYRRKHKRGTILIHRRDSHFVHLNHIRKFVEGLSIRSLSARYLISAPENFDMETTTIEIIRASISSRTAKPTLNGFA
jgi:hypothetical protein